MPATAILIAALIVLAALGLAIWTWFALAEVETELLAFSNFEGHCLDF